MSRKEIEEAIKDTGAKFIRLIDPMGQPVIPYNNPTHKINQRIDSVIKVLASKTYPPGIYKLQLKSSTTGTPIEIPIQKGDLTQAANLPQMNDNNANSLLQTLVTQMEAMSKKIDTLESELYEDENESTQTAIGDNGTQQPAAPVKEPFSWIGDCITGLLPVLDRAFDIQDKRIQLAEKKLNASNNITSSGNRNLAVTFYNMIMQMEKQPDAQQTIPVALDNLEQSDPILYAQVQQIIIENHKPDEPAA